MEVALTATEIWEGLGFFGVAGVSFAASLLVFAIGMVITGTKRWHRKHHAGKWVMMCDHCLRERGLGQ